MTLAIVDIRMPKDMVDALLREGFCVLKTPPYPRLCAPVASHPDMLMFIDGKTVYTYREYRTIAEDVFARLEDAKISIVCTNTVPREKYPDDVALNCFSVMGKLFGRKKSAAPEIVNSKKTFVDVKQGYAACSTLILDEKHIITADTAIAAAATQQGAEVLKISEGGITLSPYSFGFIGGASGVFGNTVYFTGDARSHPSYKDMEAFISQLGMRAVCLSGSPLYDFGKILFVEAD